MKAISQLCDLLAQADLHLKADELFVGAQVQTTLGEHEISFSVLSAHELVVTTKIVPAIKLDNSDKLLATLSAALPFGQDLQLNIYLCPTQVHEASVPSGQVVITKVAPNPEPSTFYNLALESLLDVQELPLEKIMELVEEHCSITEHLRARYYN